MCWVQEACCFLGRKPAQLSLPSILRSGACLRMEAFGYSLIRFDTFVRHKVTGRADPRKLRAWGSGNYPQGWAGEGAPYLAEVLSLPFTCCWPSLGTEGLGCTSLLLQIPVMALIGNDAGWTQISREQVPSLGSNVACGLAYTGEEGPGWAGRGMPFQGQLNMYSPGLPARGPELLPPF